MNNLVLCYLWYNQHGLCGTSIISYGLSIAVFDNNNVHVHWFAGRPNPRYRIRDSLWSAALGVVRTARLGKTVFGARPCVRVHNDGVELISLKTTCLLAAASSPIAGGRKSIRANVFRLADTHSTRCAHTHNNNTFTVCIYENRTSTIFFLIDDLSPIVHALWRTNDFCRWKTPARPIHAYHNAEGRKGGRIQCGHGRVLWLGWRDGVDIDGYARACVQREWREKGGNWSDVSPFYRRIVRNAAILGQDKINGRYTAAAAMRACKRVVGDVARRQPMSWGRLRVEKFVQRLGPTRYVCVAADRWCRVRRALRDEESDTTSLESADTPGPQIVQDNSRVFVLRW